MFVQFVLCCVIKWFLRICIACSTCWRIFRDFIQVVHFVKINMWAFACYVMKNLPKRSFYLVSVELFALKKLSVLLFFQQY